MTKITDPEILKSMFYRLCNQHRNFLDTIVRLEDELIFETNYLMDIKKILRDGMYNGSQKEKLNDIRQAYIDYKEKGYVPFRYQVDLPF
jgi:hypothetical protein